MLAAIASAGALLWMGLGEPALAQITTNALTVGPRIQMAPVTPRIEPRFEPRGPRFEYYPNAGGTSSDLDDPSRKGGKPKTKRTSQGPQRTSQAPGPNERRFVPDEVVIELGGNVTQSFLDALARRHRLDLLESYPLLLAGTTFSRWRITDRRSVAAVVREVEGELNIRSAQPGNVRSVQPNYLFALQQSVSANVPAVPAAQTNVSATEGDPAQYALAKLHLAEAHHFSHGESVLVAVIDSGIDDSHPELTGAVLEHFDGFGKTEPHAHGTGIAGAIVAHARLMGAAPAAHILAIEAFGANGRGAEGTTFNILKGLDWAAAKQARIVNMSFAGPADPALARSLTAAGKRGMILIAAAGNAGAKSPPLFPAADPNVIAVTATDADDHLFVAANRGNYIAVAAPGVDIFLPTPGRGYQIVSGTSFAAAYVSGVVALMLDRKPDLPPAAVRKMLEVSARDLGPKGRDPLFGYGLVDAYRAVMAAEGKPIDAATAAAAPRR
jgi:hypothetical protein